MPIAPAGRSPLRNLSTSNAATDGFRSLNTELRKLATAVRNGKLEPSQLGSAIANLKQPSNKEIDALWTPAGNDARRENFAAWKSLAAAAPNALLAPNPVNGYRATVKETALTAEFNSALFDKNAPAAKSAAQQFANLFPGSPFNSAIQAQASRL